MNKVQAGQLSMLASFMGAAHFWRLDLRPLGRREHPLSVVLATIAATLVLCGPAGNSLVGTTLPVMLCFAALGAGNGALFQLVPLRWPRRWPAP